MSSTDSQSRKYILTINDPQEHGFNHDLVIDRMHLFHPRYFCLADEIATTGTYHTHAFLLGYSPIRFSTVKRRFPTAHIEAAHGSAKENRDYVRKGGKWAETAKAETSVEGTFFEFGELPTKAEETAPKMHQLVRDVTDGRTTVEIIKNNPSFAFKGKDIDALRETLTSERFKSENRDVKVHYFYGDTGTGKTRGIFERHNAEDVCRVTDYRRKTGLRFDAYHGQDVLVFEEFHSQVLIDAMLNYLDVYPLMLPARYNDRVACYTTVYITSNLPLEQQYTDVQRYKPETWKAFLRRISEVKEYRKGDFIQETFYDQKRERTRTGPTSRSGHSATTVSRSRPGRTGRLRSRRRWASPSST